MSSLQSVFPTDLSFQARDQREASRVELVLREHSKERARLRADCAEVERQLDGCVRSAAATAARFNDLLHAGRAETAAERRKVRIHIKMCSAQIEVRGSSLVHMHAALQSAASRVTRYAAGVVRA